MSQYGIDIVVNPNGAVSGARTAKRSLLDLDASANSVSQSVAGMNFKLGGIAVVAATVAAAVIAASKSLATQADQIDRLNVRLARHTTSLGQTTAIYSQLRDISISTRTPLENNVALFARFAAIGPEIGKTNEQMLKFTEQLVKLGTLSGSTQEEQANALRQLAQGLAGGTLRAEEFNSVVEQAPEILRVVARETGRTFGQLRQDMLDGKITADLLFDSIIKGSAKTDEQFGKFKATSDELFNTAAMLARDVAAAIGEISGAQKLWNTIAQTSVDIMGDLAKSFDSMRDTPKTIDGIRAKLADVNAEIAETEAREKRYGANGVFDALFGGAGDKVQQLAELRTEAKKLNDLLKEASTPSKTPTGPRAPIADPDAKKALDSLKQQYQLSQLQGEARAKLAAVQKLGAKATAAEKAEAEKLAAEIYRLDEAQKSTTKSASELTKSSEEVARSQQQNVDTLTRLSQELELAGLKGSELAQRQAELSLNEYATPAQIEQVRQLADQIYKLEEAKRLTEEADQIRRSALPEQEQAQLALQEKLTTLKTAYEQQLITEQAYYEASAALNQKYNDDIATQEAAARSERLQTASSLFDGLAGIAGTFAGEQSGLYKTLFAASKAFAIADAVIKIQQGIANAAALPFPANLAAMGSVAAATGSIVSTISGTNMQGFQSGGYTGNMGVSQVAGVVHGQEYVMDAAATRRIGVGNLEKMASGGSVGGMNVTVINNARGASISTEQISEDEVRIIVNDELDSQFSRRMTAELSDSYSDSRSLLNRDYDINRRTTR